MPVVFLEAKEVLEAKDLEKEASTEERVVAKEKEMEMVTGTEGGKGPVNVHRNRRRPVSSQRSWHG